MLRVENLTVDYIGVRALDGCVLEVPSGAALGLIGPNGSGKTTLLDALCGFVQVTSGEILLEGRPITRFAPYRRARLGIVRAFQIPRPFADLSCLENLRVAAAAGKKGDSHGFAPDDVLDLVGLAEYRDVLPGYLSFGQKRLLDIGRALCNEPRILFLDEPSAGVNPVLAGRILDALKRAKGAGLTMVIVEHNLDFVRGICDQLTVLVEGAAFMSGTPEVVLSNDSVLDVYFGQPARVVEERLG